MRSLTGKVQLFKVKIPSPCGGPYLPVPLLVLSLLGGPRQYLFGAR